MMKGLLHKATMPPLWAATLSLAALLALVVPQPGFAKDAEKVKADQIVITATKTEKQLKEVPTSIDVVTEKEIEKSPQQTVADLLKDIPGVQVQDQSVAGVKRVVIRGESPARVLVLVDGQKISEQKSMDGAAILVDAADIERIEVIKGPSSVLHGSEAIGGVVNIITKKGGDKPVEASHRTTFDSSNDGLTVYQAVFGALDKFSYRLSGSYTDADDLHSARGEEDGSSYQSRNLAGYLGYDWEEAGVSFKWDDYRSNSNIPTHEEPGFQLKLDLPEWTRSKYALFFHKDNLSNSLAKINLDVFYQDTHKHFKNNITNEIAPGFNMLINLDTKNDQDTWGFNGQTEWTLGESHYVVAGVSVNLDNLDAWQHTVIDHPFAPNTDTTYTYEADQDTYAVFAQDEWNLVENWVLTAGLRQTFVQSKLRDTDDPNLSEESSSNNKPVGSLGLVYSGIENWRLRANYAQGYRMPNLQQLYIGTVHGSANPTFANPGLKAETSDNFELGARFNNGSWDLDTAVFYNLAENYITSEDIGGGAKRYVNADEATTMGFELLASYTFGEYGITPYFNGTFLRRRFDGTGGETWMTGDPSLSGRFGIRYERTIAETMTFDADLYSRFASTAKQEDSEDASWETYNLALGLHMGEERKAHLTLNLNNLTDRYYTEANNSLPGAGFHTVLQLGFDL